MQPVTFQTFSDVKPKGKDPLARVLHGSLDDLAEELERLNQAVAGIFVSVNETDLKGRSKPNIVALRGYHADLDRNKAEGTFDAQAALAAMPLMATMAVGTPGGIHPYLLATGGMPCTGKERWLEHEAELKAIQIVLKDHGADRAACTVERVLRVPGFMHCKAEPRLVELLTADGPRYTREQVRHAFPMVEIVSRPQPAPSPISAGPAATDRTEVLKQAASHLDKVPGSIAGAGGNAGGGDKTFTDTLTLISGFDLTEDEALDLLVGHYNPKCVPPWTDAELRHKVHGAWLTAHENANRGYLLDDHKQSHPKIKVSDRAVLLAISNCEELWHDPEQVGFLSIAKDGHRENHPIRGRGVRMWLMGLFYASEHRGLSTQECADALGLLEAQAIHDGPEHLVAVRVAHQEGRVLLDLGRSDWGVVEVTPDGWMIRSALDLPVRFKRPAGLLPLPLPKPSGDLRKLADVLNVDAEGFCLVLAWLLYALGGAGPYPLLALAGEQGTGKSTAARLIREIVDPNSVGLRTKPMDERDLAIAAQNAHIIGFDNFSFIPEWLSDALCRLATGSGFATRTLYTDSEETLFSAKRPIILNGIPDLMTRGDLADRALPVTLERIKDEDRKPETEIWREVEAVKPDILGGLLDAVAMALRRLPGLHLDHLPRMADFAKFVVAAEPALPLKEGEFLATYKEARDDGAQILLEGDPIHALVVDIVKKGNGNPITPNTWVGTALNLLNCLNEARGDDKPPRGWPTSARGLSSNLRRIAPSMRRMGLGVEHTKSGGKKNSRIVILTYTAPKDGKQPSEPSEPSEALTTHGHLVRTQNTGNRPTNAPDRPTRAAVLDVRTQTGTFGRKPISTVRQENLLGIRHTDGSDGSDGCSPSLGVAPRPLPPKKTVKPPKKPVPRPLKTVQKY